MTRSFFAVLAVSAFGVAFAPAFLEGCKATGVGDPCTPEQEYDPSFNGFDAQEVNVESKSFQCQTRLCLVNHFQGRVTCPYGQDTTGKPPTNQGTPYVDKAGHNLSACGLPSSTYDATGPSQPVTGNPNDPKKLAQVPAQCTDRSADKTVYCSCRCQNLDGKTDDGANYCKCPDGFSCKQLVTSIGAGDTGLTGGYCVKDKTDFDRGTPCVPCDPAQQNCGAFAF